MLARGQSGLDRLLVFVVAAIVLVAVLPTVFGLAGVDVRQSPEATTPTPEPAGIIVLNASGTVTGTANPGIGAVTVTVTKVGSDAPVDVTAMTATWANGGIYTLDAEGSQRPNTDGTFGVEMHHVSDSSGLVLAETGDRATLTFDLGRDDVDGVPEFGRELQPGDSAELVLATGEGQTATATVTVPEGLAGKEAVGL